MNGAGLFLGRTPAPHFVLLCFPMAQTLRLKWDLRHSERDLRHSERMLNRQGQALLRQVEHVEDGILCSTVLSVVNSAHHLYDGLAFMHHFLLSVLADDGQFSLHKDSVIHYGMVMPAQLLTGRKFVLHDHQLGAARRIVGQFRAVPTFAGTDQFFTLYFFSHIPFPTLVSSNIKYNIIMTICRICGCFYLQKKVIFAKSNVITSFMDGKVLFHGSYKVIEFPSPGGGNPLNDYGPGFYCTQNRELAREWACKENSPGAFVNHYSLEASFPLKLFNLTEQGHILNWLAVLLSNRRFQISTPFALQAREYILDTFLPDLTPYDIVTGYRADDSYFSFANLFLHNGLSLDRLNEAMHLGRLGEQTVIMSKLAFDALTFMSAESVDRSVYLPKRMARDQKARRDFQTVKTHIDYSQGTFMADILREKWKNDDSRLR